MQIPNVKLGQRVRDKVTGFTGIAVARIEYLNGCIQIQVKPKATKKGKMPDGASIDIEQIEILDKKKKGIIKTNTGGLKETPKSFGDVKI